MNSIMRARTPQNLIAAQSELLNAEVRVMLNSGVRISEATLRVARDAAQKNPAGLITTVWFRSHRGEPVPFRA